LFLSIFGLTATEPAEEKGGEEGLNGRETITPLISPNRDPQHEKRGGGKKEKIYSRVHLIPFPTTRGSHCPQEKGRGGKKKRGGIKGVAKIDYSHPMNLTTLELNVFLIRQQDRGGGKGKKKKNLRPVWNVAFSTIRANWAREAGEKGEKMGVLRTIAGSLSLFFLPIAEKRKMPATALRHPIRA